MSGAGRVSFPRIDPRRCAASALATATVTASRVRSACHAFFRHVEEQYFGGRPVEATGNSPSQCWQILSRRSMPPTVSTAPSQATAGGGQTFLCFA